MARRPVAPQRDGLPSGGLGSEPEGMVSMNARLLRGFNYLGTLPTAAPGSPLRGVALGTVLGLLSAWAWMDVEREAVELQLAEQQVLQTRIKEAEMALEQAAEKNRTDQLKREQLAREQSWQASRLQVLDGLEALALASVHGARLTNLRHEDQALTVQGQMPTAQLEPWAQAVSGRLSRWGAAELMALQTPVEPVSSARPVRFVLRWVAPAQQAAP